MKIARCTQSQDHWYVCTRKPIICPNCKLREVRKSIFGYPSPEDFGEKNIIYKVAALTFQDLEIGSAAIVMRRFY